MTTQKVVAEIGKYQLVQTRTLSNEGFFLSKSFDDLFGKTYHLPVMDGELYAFLQELGKYFTKTTRTPEESS